jgi:hypothetical protein
MKSIYFNSDVRDLLIELALNEVKYLIVGGEAVIFYGYPRLTGDIDIFYDSTHENVEKLYAALRNFWDNSIPGMISKADLLESKTIVQFGYPPNRIDLLNYINGVEFKTAWENRVVEKMNYNKKKYAVYYISLSDLIINKRAVGRNKDMDDLRFLSSIHYKKENQ